MGIIVSTFNTYSVSAAIRMEEREDYMEDSAETREEMKEEKEENEINNLTILIGSVVFMVTAVAIIVVTCVLMKKMTQNQSKADEKGNSTVVGL